MCKILDSVINTIQKSETFNNNALIEFSETSHEFNNFGSFLADYCEIVTVYKHNDVLKVYIYDDIYMLKLNNSVCDFEDITIEYQDKVIEELQNKYLKDIQNEKSNKKNS